MLALAAIISVSSSLGYALPAIIGLESMGVPSPGETALILAAVLASQGKLQIWLVILIGVCSAIVGDNCGYLLGRRLGREVLEAPGPLHRRRVRLIRAGDRFFERHGPKAVFLARWIALVRFAAAWLAGINHMRFREFFFWNALGGISWGITYGLVGYYGGAAAADVITRFGVYALVGLGVLVVAYFAFSRWRERRQARALGADEEPLAPEPGARSVKPGARSVEPGAGAGDPGAGSGDRGARAGEPRAERAQAGGPPHPGEPRAGRAQAGGPPHPGAPPASSAQSPDGSGSSSSAQELMQ
ncbi:MAG TPA: DedA family protein [Solirubrobacteraceae bacterium]|nr:DedA family protein [Solirubrobacteraceae bacterium]